MIRTKKETTQVNLVKIIELGDKLTQVNAHNNRLKARVESMQETINKQREQLESMQKQLKLVRK
jgi:hypothetical protein